MLMLPLHLYLLLLPTLLLILLLSRPHVDVGVALCITINPLYLVASDVVVIFAAIAPISDTPKMMSTIL
jgi:hypothetical protein